MRYLRPTTHEEITSLWGFYLQLPVSARGKQLYLVLKKDGTIHQQGGGRYITEDELRPDDVVL